MRTGWSGAGAAALGAAVLASVAACSSPTPSSPPSTPVPTASLTVPGATPGPTPVPGARLPGLPASFGEPGEVHAAGVGWTSDDTLLYVALWGSSSCPPVASSPATRTPDGGIAVVSEDRYAGQACTADLAPSTTVVALPHGVEPGAALRVLVDGHGPVELPAAADGTAPVWVDAG
jgi:hypothetical protein